MSAARKSPAPKRWCAGGIPERGLILPSDFIPLAESTRDIDRLTLWTIEQVIADQQSLRADGQDITVFINISGQLLSNAKFVKRACEIVSATRRVSSASRSPRPR